MKKLVFTTLTLASLFFSYSLHADLAPTKPLALVYNGPGACLDGNCAKNAAAIAERGGYRVKFVGANDILTSLPWATLWIQPGGDALVVRAAMGEENFFAIKKFVLEGGRYLGFCAGAYMAGPWLDNDDTLPGLDIIPAYTYEYSKWDRSPKMEMVHWDGKIRHLYFQDGAAFKVTPENAKIIRATYRDGVPAIVYSDVGHGKVALAGMHPEAPSSWAVADKLVDKDGDDTDIAMAMISWLK